MPGVFCSVVVEACLQNHLESFKQQAPGLVSLIPTPKDKQVWHWLRNWFESVCVYGELCRPFLYTHGFCRSLCSSLCLKNKTKKAELVRLENVLFLHSGINKIAQSAGGGEGQDDVGALSY